MKKSLYLENADGRSAYKIVRVEGEKFVVKFIDFDEHAEWHIATLHSAEDVLEYISELEGRRIGLS